MSTLHLISLSINEIIFQWWWHGIEVYTTTSQFSGNTAKHLNWNWNLAFKFKEFFWVLKFLSWHN